MGFTIKDFSQLKVSFKESVDALMKHHDVEEVDQLTEPRRGQVKFLQAIIKELDQKKGNANPSRNPRILTGAMIVIRGIIEGTYSHLSPENSVFYKLLAKTIGLDENNQLEDEDIFAAVKDFRGTFVHLIYIHGDSRNGMNTNSIFAGIEGYSYLVGNKSTNEIMDVLDKIDELMKTASMRAYNRADQKVRQSLKEAEESSASKGKGLLSSLFKSKPAADDDQDNNNNASASSLSSTPA